MLKTHIVVCLFMSMFTSVCFAQSLPSEISNAIAQYQPAEMLPSDMRSYATLHESFTSLGTLELTGENQVVLSCIEVPDKANQLQLKAIVTGTIHKGDTLLILLKAKAIEYDSKYDSGILHLNMERLQKWTKSLGYTTKVTQENRWITIPFKSRENFAPNEAQVTIPIGFYKQKIQISDLRLLNFGTQIQVDELFKEQYQYEGSQANAPWREQAAVQIEKCRKALLKIQVVDQQGKPIINAKVHVQMQRHAFGFGTAVNEWRLMGTEKDDAIYRQKFLELFNRATPETHLKWKSWVAPDRKVRSYKAIQWLKDHNIAIRGHTLVWPSWSKSPKFVKEKYQADPKGLRQVTLDHINDLASAFKGQLVEWDVANEIHNNRDFLDALGDEEVDRWFKAVRKIEPDLPLYLNDFGIIQGNAGYNLVKQDSYYQIIKQMQQRETPIDGVGFQAHFRLHAVTSPIRTWEILDRYEKLGLKLAITEYDLAWVSEAFQAQYLTDFMTATFAHPAVNQFVMWGFWDGSHWREDGGMYAKDWREKPSLKAYKNLVFKKWWTDLTLPTDKQGTVTTRGFLGDYKITVNVGGKTREWELKLTKDAKPIALIMP